MTAHRTLRGTIDRWRASERGTALIEFAIVLPVTLALYLGGFQFSDAIACNRKVTVTARAIADLTSQYSAVSVSQLDTILGASAQVMAPYSTASVQVRVSQISVDQYYHTTVAWSRAINGAARTPGSSFALPASMTIAGVSLIYAEVSYTYTPTMGFGMVRPVTLSEKIYMVPRVTSTIACNDCATS